MSRIKKIDNGKPNLRLVKEGMQLLGKGAKVTSIPGLIHEVLSLVGKELFQVIHKLIEEPKTLDELADMYSQATDKVILEGIEEGLSFVGGKFKIGLLNGNDDNIAVSMEAYFQNSAKQWIKKSNSNMIPTRKITPEAFNELRIKNIIEYELEEPQYSA